MQFAHGAIFQDGRHQLSGSNISRTVQHRMDFLVSDHRFFGSNNPTKIFPGRLDEAEVKIQNGGTKLATDRKMRTFRASLAVIPAAKKRKENVN